MKTDTVMWNKFYKKKNNKIKILTAGFLAVCFLSGGSQTALAAAQQGTLRYTNAGYTAPEGAWLQSSDEIKWVDRDVEYLTANKDAILEHWNNLLAEVQG